ncbi:MAG: DNA topoisomerase IB [Acidimicrobiia bacterium]
MDVNGYVDQAAEAGLLYMTDEAPGHRRIRRGKGFTYVTSSGKTVGKSERERIKSLAIPPAWETVWISPELLGHILATGHDAAGRKQYIYHPLWEVVRDEVKFQRMGEFGAQIARIRKLVDTDLRRRGLGREKVVALAVAVLDRTLIRVGNRRYADENGSYGLTTLTEQHLGLNGHQVQLDFEAKGGAEHQVVFESRQLASLLARCQELRGQTLFSYEVDGDIGAIRSDDVNDYLSAAAGFRCTAKDMRTWGATTHVVQQLAAASQEGKQEARILQAIDSAAEALGNTRAVCRASYVHPEISDAYLDGRLDDAWERSRRGPWLSRAESAGRKILESD